MLYISRLYTFKGTDPKPHKSDALGDVFYFGAVDS